MKTMMDAVTNRRDTQTHGMCYMNQNHPVECTHVAYDERLAAMTTNTGTRILLFFNHPTMTVLDKFSSRVLSGEYYGSLTILWSATTMFHPTAAVEQVVALEDGCLVVTGDRKGPMSSTKSNNMLKTLCFFHENDQKR